MENKRVIHEREKTIPEELNYSIGMKYYKYLKVMLVLGAILNLGSTITYFNGDVYLKQGLSPTLVYLEFPNLKLLDIAFGIVIMVLAAFQFYVRNQLAWKTRRAPKMIVILHAISFVPNMIYNIGVGIVVGDVNSAILSSVIPTLIICPIYAYITYVYFAKRKFMFVN